MGRETMRELFDAQFYPKNGINNFYNNFKDNEDNKFIGKKTKISSMGSCFAIEIAKGLKNNEYNYLIEETPTVSRRKLSADGSTVYNTTCMKQIFEYSFGKEFNPIVRWWYHSGDGKTRDPYRKDVKYDVGSEDKLFELHKQSSYKALSNSDVIILTLGLTETWKDKRDGYVYWRVPPMKLFDSKIHEFHLMTVDEVRNDLQQIKNIVDEHNPKCKIIITVSPVPLVATFRKDVDIVMASCESKSTLRTSVGEFIRNTENTYYFPSFEYLVFGEENPYRKDYRHIKDDYIEKMMKLFEKMFVRNEDLMEKRE